MTAAEINALRRRVEHAMGNATHGVATLGAGRGNALVVALDFDDAAALVVLLCQAERAAAESEGYVWPTPAQKRSAAR